MYDGEPKEDKVFAELPVIFLHALGRQCNRNLKKGSTRKSNPGRPLVGAML